MSSSKSSSSFGKIQKFLYYDSESETRSSNKYQLWRSDIQVQLPKLIDYKQYEDILKVQVYRTPLLEQQWTDWYWHHKYIVFETKGWWWSIEKNDAGIVIQRSKTKLYVSDFLYQQRRCKTQYWDPKLVKTDVGRYTMKELIGWLSKSQQSGPSYYQVCKNDCRHFAKKMFDKFTKSETLDITE